MPDTYLKNKQELANALIPNPKPNTKLIRNFSDGELVEVEIPDRDDNEDSRYANCLDHLSNQEKLRKYIEKTEGKLITKEDLIPVTLKQSKMKNKNTKILDKIKNREKYRIDLRDNVNNKQSRQANRFEEFKIHERKSSISKTVSKLEYTIIIYYNILLIL